MFYKEISDEYKKEFEKLNITNVEEMLSILNGFNRIAELGYTVYMKNRTDHD